LRRTKIVCTIGPASESRERQLEMARAGMDVARLNFSHGSHDWHAAMFQSLRAAADELDRPLSVLQDLTGPKLRIGEIPPPGLDLDPGDRCLLSTSAFDAGSIPRIQVPIPELLAALQPGHHVFLDDGQIELLVTDRRDPDVVCEVQHGGRLCARKGISAPSVPFAIPALTPKDLRDLDLGLQLGVDWVAVSFVRRASDLDPVQAAIRQAGSGAQIVAKVEQPEAVEAIDEVLDASDAIMVARGDLGVEMPLHQVPMIQKDLICRANAKGKPVITATQMLESMTHSARPTRAEVSDVANAIIDGTGAVMLSGETAMGENPVQVVKTMDAIAGFTESKLDYHELLREGVRAPAGGITDAICQGVAEIAHDLQVAAILCSTTSGYTARMVARMRPQMPIIAATASQATYRGLPLIWGVRPLLVAPTTNTDEMLAATVQRALDAGWICSGDTVVITMGSPVGSPGHTNLIKVQTV
jgi:pyruvate kinase